MCRWKAHTRPVIGPRGSYYFRGLTGLCFSPEISSENPCSPSSRNNFFSPFIEVETRIFRGREHDERTTGRKEGKRETFLRAGRINSRRWHDDNRSPTERAGFLLTLPRVPATSICRDSSGVYRQATGNFWLLRVIGPASRLLCYGRRKRDRNVPVIDKSGLILDSHFSHVPLPLNLCSVKGHASLNSLNVADGKKERRKKIIRRSKIIF